MNKRYTNFEIFKSENSGKKSLLLAFEIKKSPQKLIWLKLSSAILLSEFKQKYKINSNIKSAHNRIIVLFNSKLKNRS